MSNLNIITLSNDTFEQGGVASLNLLGKTYDEFMEISKGLYIERIPKASEDLTINPDIIDYYIEREKKYPLRLFGSSVQFLSLSWTLTVEFTPQNIIGCWKLFCFSDKDNIIPETTTNVIRNLLNKQYNKYNDGYSTPNRFKWLGEHFYIELTYEWKSERSKKNFIQLTVEQF